MLKTSFVVAALIVATIDTLAQNLVPNGSFETITTCPNGQGDINKAGSWNGFPATSDLFNSCNQGEVGVPNNGPGSQPPHSGSGYAGIIVNWNDRPYDYLYAPLESDLQTGKTYCVSLWVSCADNARLATDDICVFFTSDTPNETALDQEVYVARNPEGNVLDNTQDWVQIKESLVATGDERFIVIGSCRSEEKNYKTINAASSFEPDTYYYIDEVSVIPRDFSLEIEVVGNPKGIYCADDTVVLTTNLGDVGSSVWSNGTNAPSVVVTSSGTYSVTTQVGCHTYEADMEVVFEDCSCSLVAADVFTPNGDGKNDVFYLIPVIDVARFDLKIYNRWGKQVFKSNSVNQRWNGTIDGKEASAGVYVWIAKVTCIKDNQLFDNELKGYVTILK